VLDNVTELNVWADRVRASDTMYRIVARWIVDLEHAPWQAPSRPLTQNVGGVSERREALLPEAEVMVTYETEFHSGLVTLLDID
jgi:hypothetical protein